MDLKTPLPQPPKSSGHRATFRTTLLSNTYPFDIVNKLAPVQPPPPIERNRLQRINNRTVNVIMGVTVVVMAGVCAWHYGTGQHLKITENALHAYRRTEGLMLRSANINDSQSLEAARLATERRMAAEEAFQQQTARDKLMQEQYKSQRKR